MISRECCVHIGHNLACVDIFFDYIRTPPPRSPSRVHAIVLVSTLHKPSQRAIAFARATRPDTLTAITVNVDDTGTRELQRQREQRGMKVPLKMLESPYREIHPAGGAVREEPAASP